MMNKIVPVAVIVLAIAPCFLLISVNAMAAKGVSIYGFITDRSGLPVPNATVTLFADDVRLPMISNPATTDSNGYYEFYGIQRGIYCIMAEKNAYSSSATFSLQTWDRAVNITLLGSMSDLTDVQAPTPTPAPAIIPVVPNATVAPAVSRGPTLVSTPVPGFGVALALLGIFSTAAIKRFVG